MKRVVVGLSGGVDSSVTALLLKEQGFEVTGVTMLTTSDSGDYFEDAKKVADYLGIEYITVDFRDRFKSCVIDYFMKEYLDGRTPNPCIACNSNVKWEALLSAAKQTGASKIATGHYSDVTAFDNGRFAIKKAGSLHKDQSYALCRLSQEQLSHTLMPLSSYSKDDVRDIAKHKGIPVAFKPDSQDVCFIPDNDHGRYIKENSRDPVPGPGRFLDADGKVLGTHNGIIHYTIGQRKGLNVAAGHRVFVSDIRPEDNTIILSHEDIYSKELYFADVNFMAIPGFTDGQVFTARIRYNHKGQECSVYSVDSSKGIYKCVFKEPARAITPGQSVVLYDDDHIAGAGTIIKFEED